MAAVSLLLNLDAEYDTFTTAYLAVLNEKEVKLDYLAAKILEEELRMKQVTRNIKCGEIALQMVQ
jgi:hypothetical protein